MKEVEQESRGEDDLRGAGHRPWRRQWALVVVLIVAAGLRIVGLGGVSFYYDEVVTMRVARASGPAESLRLLRAIDATRAPLHPLLLQGWIAVFGPSEVAARSLSVAFGLAIVVLIYHLGRTLYDAPTGLWAAWLAAISPTLVYFSREVRLYAWLVLLTGLAWSILFSFRRSAPAWKQAAFGVGLVALVYSYPLGLFAVVALGLAYLLDRSSFRLPLRNWLAIHVAWALAIAPWLPQFMDHRPEITFGHNWRLLVPWVLTFTGGFVATTFLVFLPLALHGAFRFDRGADRFLLDHPTASRSLLIWFAIPPALLYAYSWAAHSIFGEARYTLFVGPAYLLLLARGLVKVPWPLRYAIAALSLAVACRLMGTMVFPADGKSDWRAAAAIISAHDPRAPFVVLPNLASEVESARHYLGPEAPLIYLEPDPLSDVVTRAIGARRLDPGAIGDAVWVGLVYNLGAPKGRVPDWIERGFRAESSWRLPALRLTYYRRRTESIEPRMHPPSGSNRGATRRRERAASAPIGEIRGLTPPIYR